MGVIDMDGPHINRSIRDASNNLQQTKGCEYQILINQTIEDRESKFLVN